MILIEEYFLSVEFLERKLYERRTLITTYSTSQLYNIFAKRSYIGQNERVFEFISLVIHLTVRFQLKSIIL